jgi:kinesin family member C1
MMGRPGIDQKGIIPRSLEQIFKSGQSLESQGWKYSMQVSIRNPIYFYRHCIINLY